MPLFLPPIFSGAATSSGPSEGTWLGLTRSGLIAVLTNFREDGPQPPPSAISRGLIVRDFLEAEEGKPGSFETEAYVRNLLAGEKGKELGKVGGFSLVCGRIGERLAVISNRLMAKHHSETNGHVRNVDDVDIPWIFSSTSNASKTSSTSAVPNQTVGLSNAAFGDRGWKKVTDGEHLLEEAIRESLMKEESEDDLVQRFLTILSRETLPRSKKDNGKENEDDVETHMPQLRHTILVPPLGKKVVPSSPSSSSSPPTKTNGTTTPITETKAKPRADEIAAAAAPDVALTISVANGAEATAEKAANTAPTKTVPLVEQVGMSGVYGTQKQTVILADREGQVRFFERTLFDGDVEPVPRGQGDVDIRFTISAT